MDETSQQEAVDSQQTLLDSQMSVDQDGQESQSQMDVSTDDVESSPQCSSPIPKQPKMHHEENPVSSTTDSHVPRETEKDNGLCQNGNEAMAEESEKEEEMQLIPEKDVAQQKLEEVAQDKLEKVEQEKLEEVAQEKMEEEEGQKLEELGQEKLEEVAQEKLEKVEHEKLEETGQEKLEEVAQEKMEEEQGQKLEELGQANLEEVAQEKLEKVEQEKLEEAGQERLEEVAEEKMEEEEGQKLKEDKGQEKLKEQEGQEKLKEKPIDSFMDEDEEDGFQFPKTLEDFKYAFNEDGQLRHTENNEQGFKFEVRKNDHRFNQMHYEALGEAITEYIYELLETKAGLKKVYLNEDENEESGFVFMSENALTTTDKLLILIHGSGVVRAGQWARRLIINDCLDSGTQLPYIQRAMEEGYEVLVMNTNDNFHITSNGQRIWKKGSSSPNEHGLNVWDKFVANTPVKHVAIVAHSYGGVVTMDLAMERMDSFGKVFAIAFTDSVHFMSRDRLFDLHSWFVKNAVNWVSSNKPLDTVIDDRGYDCNRVSAGTMRHEETSHYSIDSIFQFLAKKEDEVKNIKPLNPRPGVAVPEMEETSDEGRKDVETEQIELKEESIRGQETQV